MAFISLIAPTGKERLLPWGAGHALVSLGFLVFAAFKPSVGFKPSGLHLPVAPLKHRCGRKGVGEAPTGVCAGTRWWDVGSMLKHMGEIVNSHGGGGN